MNLKEDLNTNLISAKIAKTPAIKENCKRINIRGAEIWFNQLVEYNSPSKYKNGKKSYLNNHNKCGKNIKNAITTDI